jgi:hypothetical protein
MFPFMPQATMYLGSWAPGLDPDSLLAGYQARACGQPIMACRWQWLLLPLKRVFPPSILGHGEGAMPRLVGRGPGLTAWSRPAQAGGRSGGRCGVHQPACPARANGVAWINPGLGARPPWENSGAWFFFPRSCFLRRCSQCMLLELNNNLEVEKHEIGHRQASSLDLSPNGSLLFSS